MTRSTFAITGAAGFIGSHAVDLCLAKGHRVQAYDASHDNFSANLVHHLDNDDLTLTLGDIRELPKDAFAGCDYVLHFAGMMDLVPSIEKPALYMDVNVQGTVAALEAARHAGVSKFVYAASSSCYGDFPECPTSETAPIDCVHPYAMSKYQGEQAAFHWHQVYKLPVNSIRIFNAYGPRLRGSGTYGAVFGVFLKQKLEGHPYTVVGDGTQSRDFVYASDVAEAFYAAAMTERTGEVFNVGAGHPRSVNEIIECLGGGVVVHLPKRPGEPDCTWADISNIKAQLGWSPKVDFADGVARTVEDIESFRRIPLWTPESIRKATETWMRELGR